MNSALLLDGNGKKRKAQFSFDSKTNWANVFEVQSPWDNACIYEMEKLLFWWFQEFPVNDFDEQDPKGQTFDI